MPWLCLPAVGGVPQPREPPRRADDRNAYHGPGTRRHADTILEYGVYADRCKYVASDDVADLSLCLVPVVACQNLLGVQARLDSSPWPLASIAELSTM